MSSLRKRSDLLRLAIFEDLKSCLAEIGDHAVVVVNYGGVQRNFVDFLLEDEDIVVCALVPRPWLGTCTVSPG